MTPRIRQWAGLRVWLVGASSGLGAALAVQLAGRGAHVVLTARSLKPLLQVAATCREAGGEATVAVADVCDAPQMARVAASIDRTVGGIDVMIYLAGVYRPAGLAAVAGDVGDAERTIDTNLTGALRTLGALWPRWQGRPVEPGRSRGIVLVASVAGYRGLPQSLAYGASKAGLIHLAESLAIELAVHGVGVWVVNPGFIRTRLTDQNRFAMPAMMTPEAAAAALIDGLGRGRFEIHFPWRFSALLKAMRWLPDRLYFFLLRQIALPKEVSS